MINRSTVEIYLDLILRCKPHSSLKNYHLHGVVLLSIYKMLEDYGYNQAVTLSEKTRLQIQAYLETMVFLSTFAELEQYLEPSPLLATLTKEQFKLLQNVFKGHRLFESIDEQNFKYVTFSLNAYRELKSLLNEEQFLAINQKIQFPLFNSHAARYMQKVYLKLCEMMGGTRVNFDHLNQFYQEQTSQAELFAQAHLQEHSIGMQYKAHRQNPQKFIHQQLVNQHDSGFRNFASLSQALFLLRQEEQVFCMNLTVKLANETTHTEKLYYRYSDSKPAGFKLIDLDEVSLDTPILTMDMTCFNAPQSKGNIELCFRERSVDAFMKKFKATPIENLIHLSFSEAMPTHQSSKRDFEVNLKQINFKVFQAVRGLAAHYKPLVKIENLRLEVQMPSIPLLKIPRI